MPTTYLQLSLQSSVGFCGGGFTCGAVRALMGGRDWVLPAASIEICTAPDLDGP